LFKKADRVPIIINNIGLSLWLAFLGVWTYNTSLATFTKYYFIPYLLTNHWIVMITYLQHTDPTIPHFRKDAWTFLRGASTTVDRPLLGWMGRFFLHNVSHDHVAHHFFSSIPSYNGPEVSKRIRKVLGEDYNSDSTNTWRALYRSFTNCEVCPLWLFFSYSVALDCTQSSSLKMKGTSLCGRIARGWLFARLPARSMRSSRNVL
jgi:fatty acid desaturase